MDPNKPYTNELIAMLFHCRTPVNADDEHDMDTEPDDIAQYSPDENLKLKIHVVIYNFLALSTVLEGSRDVGAVAVYELSDTIRVYYSKNQVNDRCQAHVAQLAELVRNAAMDPQVNRKQMAHAYFQLMLSNAHSKLIDRLQKFKDMIRRQPPPGDIGFITTHDLVEYLKGHALDDSAFVIVNSADIEAADYSPSKNLYEGLSIVLENLIDKTSTPLESPEDYMKLSFHCYMFGHSSLTVKIAKEKPQIIPLIEATQKFGDYLRGITRLFRTITKDNSTRERYSRFEIILVPSPQPVNMNLYPNWFDVLQAVYRRRKGQDITISKNQFRRVYGGIVNYERYLRTDFLQHAEITLLNHLVPSHTPTVIGISKACCVLCYQYVTALNKFNEKQGRKKWIVGGRHGNIYNWYCSSWEDLSSGAENENEFNFAIKGVKEWIENRIIQMIENCEYQSEAEFPCQLSDKEGSESRFSPDWKY